MARRSEAKLRCARCLTALSRYSGRLFCERCREAYQLAYAEGLRRVILLYSDPQEYFRRVREAQQAGEGREYVGDIRLRAPAPERPAATRKTPDEHLRRMERRVMLHILEDLALAPEDLEGPLRSPPGGGLRALLDGEPPQRIYPGSPTVLAYAWPIFGDGGRLERRFRDLVGGGAVRRLAGLPEDVSMHHSAGERVALWGVLSAEEHSRLLAPPPVERDDAPGEMSGASSTRGAEGNSGRTRTVGPPTREHDVAWLSRLSEDEILSLSTALGAETRRRELEDRVPRRRTKRGWKYEREGLGRGWLQKDPRPSGGTTRGYWVFRWMEDGRIRHEYIGNDDALSVWRRRHPEGL